MQEAITAQAVIIETLSYDPDAADLGVTTRENGLCKSLLEPQETSQQPYT